jgi:predicted nicotinamide N-methyase
VLALNAAANDVPLKIATSDVVGAPCRWDLILCGDVCYEAPMTNRILPWLRRMAAQAEVWIADPGRAYLPREGLTPFASYIVPTSLELEDRTERTVTLYGLAPG